MISGVSYKSMADTCPWSINKPKISIFFPHVCLFQTHVSCGIVVISRGRSVHLHTSIIQFFVSDASTLVLIPIEHNNAVLKARPASNCKTGTESVATLIPSCYDEIRGDPKREARDEGQYESNCALGSHLCVPSIHSLKS